VKILYALSNNLHSKIQADRFLSQCPKDFKIKVSAYRKYLPYSGSDWTLDPLLIPEKQNQFCFQDNKYLDVYCEQVKSFNPDLIISDLELYTSYVALILNKKIWHVSNRLHNFAIDHLFKAAIKIHKSYKTLHENSFFYQKINEIISAADKNYLYSHFCDMDERIELKSNFEWIRPYYYSAKKSEAHRHKYVAFMSDFSVVKFLKDKNDAVLFSLRQESYDNIICKQYSDIEEYSCNLSNCDYFICNGSESLISDAFYNQRKFILLKDFTRIDNLFNYQIYHKIYNFLLEGDYFIPSKINFNKEVLFLHEAINNFKNEMEITGE